MCLEVVPFHKGPSVYHEFEEKEKLIRELDFTLDDIKGFRKNIINCVLPLGSKSRLPSIDSR